MFDIFFLNRSASVAPSARGTRALYIAHVISDNHYHVLTCTIYRALVRSMFRELCVFLLVSGALYIAHVKHNNYYHIKRVQYIEH